MEAEPFFFTTYFYHRWLQTLWRQIKITNLINQLKKYIF